VVQAGHNIKQGLISKITNAKRAAGVAQVIKHLPSRLEVLNSNPSTAKTITKSLEGLKS
jgi:hypothetical protein